MKLKLFILCSLLIKLVVTEIDKHYLEDSILVKLKNYGGSFLADIECVRLDDAIVEHAEEKFDFKNGLGQYIVRRKLKDEKNFETIKVIYFNTTDEVYLINKHQRSCEIKKRNDLKNIFCIEMIPRALFTKNVTYTILGPNVLLEILLKNSKIANCTLYNGKQTICSLEIKNRNETGIFINYYFENNLEKKMIPMKIVIQKKDRDSKWMKMLQINYFQFTPHFSKNKDSFDHNLPIGYGCKRIQTIHTQFPTVETKMGDFFELEFEVVFKYLNSRKEIDILSKNAEQSDKLSINEGKNDTEMLAKQTISNNFNTRIYYNKIYHNNRHSINVIETINEFTNASTRTIYDTQTHINYDMLMDEESCISYHLPPIHNINYFYIQDLFINHKEFFDTTKAKYNYIGNYTVNDILCEVFETKMSNYSKESPQSNDIENEQYLNSIRQNVNGIKSDHAIVTHYYPVKNSFWLAENSEFKVPMKIEIRLFANNDTSLEIAKQTINVANFRPSTLNNFNMYGIYDLSKCTEHLYDYNWFVIEFDRTTKSINDLIYHENEIKSLFKNMLNINPLRFGEVLIDYYQSSIYVTAKLFELAQVRKYFDSKNNVTISRPVENKYAENEELCAKRCFSNKNCGAYSYCSELNCKLWTDINFEKEFNDHYNWNKIETMEEKGCIFKTRLVKFSKSDHQSNREFLEDLDAKINDGMYLRFNNITNATTETLRAIELRINNPHTQTSELNDKQLDNERAYIKFNDLFEIIYPEKALNSVKLKGNDGKLIVSSRGLTLWECQFICINEAECQSMSFCKGFGECILTTLNNTNSIEEYTLDNSKCATSLKNYLSRYQKHHMRKLTDETTDKHTGNRKEEINPNKCAALCSRSEKCLSFDFCKGEEGEKGFSCFLHQIHPSKNNIKKVEVNWTSQAHCDHYTYKHTIDFDEFAAIELKEKIEFIDIQEEISLDSCAALCLESETCNTFDYCMRKNKKNNHINKIQCRLTNNYFDSSIQNKNKSFECSTYSRINPIIFSKSSKTNEIRVHGGFVSFLSILNLVIGVAIGVGAAYYIIKNSIFF